jgi:2-polyprenyl-3-methyl-5-hydroxy-6-metoxy-1,4-benzoquinol methylase
MSRICPACENINNHPKEYILSSTRGQNKKWMKCSSCNSYSIIDDYEKQNEVTHAQNTSYGTIADGLQLTSIKKKLYTTILFLAKKYSEDATNQSWLDIGCSFGGLIELVKENGYQTSGIDILPEAITHLSSKGYNVQLANSIGQLPDTTTFDIISAIDCHYYWPTQNTEFGLIKNHLNKNGLLILKTSNKSWLVSLGLFIRNFSRPVGDKMIARALNDHRFSMPLSSLLSILKKHGYTIEEVNIQNAYFSDDTKAIVKIGFFIGGLIYKISGLLIAPGAVVVAKNNTKKI